MYVYISFVSLCADESQFGNFNSAMNNHSMLRVAFFFFNFSTTAVITRTFHRVNYVQVMWKKSQYNEMISREKLKIERIEFNFFTLSLCTVFFVKKIICRKKRDFVIGTNK